MSRYIDAKKLIEKTHNYYPSIDNYCCSKKVVLLSDIEKEPTADVAEVKHGKWITVEPFNPYEDIMYKCSCCKNTVNLFGLGNYCMNCGAKMDKGENEDDRYKQTIS